jgi:hypothetical protein
VFPWITQADVAHDKTGVYHVDLSVPFDTAQPLIAKLEKVLADFIATLPIAKQKALTPKPVYMDELTRPTFPDGATDDEKQAIKNAFVGEPTGNVLFRCKLKSLVVPKDGSEPFNQAPVVVYAETGEAVDKPVYNGSIIKVKGQVVPYTNNMSATVGVTLRMKAVQVIELQTGSGDGASFWTNFDNDGE